MTITSAPFGLTASGEAVAAYTLQNASGTRVTILSYGATIQSFRFAGVELVHGYPNIGGYETGTAYFGATIGRTCNRIAGARFDLNGKSYSLFPNDGRNQNHGGHIGFSHRMWKLAYAGNDGLKLRLFSPDGEEGYPGNVTATVLFSLTDDSELRIRYHAETDCDTLLSMTNHSYFNLDGGGSVLEHALTCPADFYVENDAENLPTGQLLPVDGTPFDFRAPKALGCDISEPHIQLRQASGYDHTLVAPEAVLSCPAAGISLRIKTDLPGIHLYTANFTHEIGRAAYGPRSAVCLETQLFADAIHHPQFPSAVLSAGASWDSETVYALSYRK